MIKIIILVSLLVSSAYSTACTMHAVSGDTACTDVALPACLNGVCVAEATFTAFTCTVGTAGKAKCTSNALFTALPQCGPDANKCRAFACTGTGAVDAVYCGTQKTTCTANVCDYPTPLTYSCGTTNELVGAKCIDEATKTSCHTAKCITPAAYKIATDGCKTHAVSDADCVAADAANPACLHGKCTTGTLFGAFTCTAGFAGQGKCTLPALNQCGASNVCQAFKCTTGVDAANCGTNKNTCSADGKTCGYPAAFDCGVNAATAVKCKDETADLNVACWNKVCVTAAAYTTEAAKTTSTTTVTVDESEEEEEASSNTLSFVLGLFVTIGLVCL